jgi:hypothetical protein
MSSSIKQSLLNHVGTDSRGSADVNIETKLRGLAHDLTESRMAETALKKSSPCWPALKQYCGGQRDLL